MVKVGKCALIALMYKKWTLHVELTKKKTSHCKSRDFLRKRRLKTSHFKSRAFCLKTPTKKKHNLEIKLRSLIHREAQCH